MRPKIGISKWRGYAPLPQNLSFFVLLLTNFFLAYVQSPIEIKLWAGSVGFLSALLIALKTTPSKKQNFDITSKNEFLPKVPSILLIALMGAAAFGRIYKLADLSVWPMWDEGHYSYLAINLEESWHPQFFFGSQQYMPVYTWLQAFFFRVFGPSLDTMWLYPALYSIALLPLSYWAIRQYFSRSLSTIYLLLLCFSFWPIYVSRFATDIGWCLIWEHLTLLAFAWFLQSDPSSKKNDSKKAAITGLIMGCGWYFSKFWLSCLLVFTVGMILLIARKRSSRPFLYLSFFSSLAAPLIPMALLILQHRYGGHIRSYLLFQESDLSWTHHLIDSLSYVTALFWGPLDKGYFCFGPLWGGFLNPFLASCFFISLYSAWKYGGRGLGLGLIAALGIFLAQGFLSNTMEDMRIAPILPLMLLVTARGIQALLESAPMTFRGAILTALLLCSIALDADHLLGPYRSWAVPSQASGRSKSLEHFRAFQVLKGQGQTKGPGLVLEEFTTDIFDQTLLVATYPFNAARNRLWKPENAGWAGLILSPIYQAKIKKTFPGAKKTHLSAGLDLYDESSDLWIIPITDENRKIFMSYVKANRKIQDLYDDLPYDVADPSYEKVIAELLDQYHLFKGDSFLESIFWAKIAEYSWEEKDRIQFLDAAGRVVTLGYPQSRLCYRTGLAYQSIGNYREAKKLFLQAGTLDPEYRPPTVRLNWLDEMIKKKKRSSAQ